MATSIAFLACVIAGFINGSYAFPVKHMPSLKKETIWFYFSFLAFLIVPVLSILSLNHNAFSVLAFVPGKSILALIGGGIVFGIGMVLFTLCLNKLGMGIAFILNISLGTIGGSLLPLFIFHSNLIATPFGYANILALILFIFAMTLTTQAIHIRDKGKSIQKHAKNTFAGFVLGVFSGLFCAMQGFSYAYALPFFKSAGQIDSLSEYLSVNVPWVIIFASALIPYALFQFYLQLRSNSFVNIFRADYRKNIEWIIIMGILYFSSILIYSKAVQTLGAFGQIIAWPLFMIFIILSANFWSLIQGEWKDSSSKSKLIFSIGVFIIILAIILLGYAANIRA